MSTDYALICRKCDQMLEMAGSISAFYADRLNDTQALCKFLFEHVGHEIVFVSEHSEEYNRWLDMHPDNGRGGDT